MKSEEASETGAFIYKIQKEIPVQEESSQIKILVTAFDKAGNSLSQTSETLQVDGKNQELKLSMTEKNQKMDVIRNVN